MTVPTFRLKGSALDLLDVTDPTGLKAIILTPNTRGQVVSIGADLYRPEPVAVDLDQDGGLNGDDGIELLAALEALESPLQWNVQIVAEAGFPRPPASFWFDAPAAGQVVYLGSVSPSPQVSPTAITRGPRGVDDVVVVGNAVQFRYLGDPVGDPIPLWISGLFGGTPSSTADGYISGGKP